MDRSDGSGQFDRDKGTAICRNVQGEISTDIALQDAPKRFIHVLKPVELHEGEDATLK